MRIRAKILLICLFLGCFCCSGCWDRIEIENLGLVMLAGFDRTEDGLIKVSVHVAKPFAMAGSGQETIDEKSFWPVSTTGHTIFQAVRNLASESPRQIFWDHNRVVLIGEKLAREEDGIAQVLDFYSRDLEPRLSTYLMVVKGSTLEEIMSARFELERQPNRGFEEIGKVVTARKSTSWVPTVLEFCRELETEGLEPVLGAVEIVNRPVHQPEQGMLREIVISHSAQISGLGAFKGDRLVGWLNDRQSRGVLWVRGKVKSGIIVIHNPQEENRLISLEIRQTGREIIPQMIDGRPVIKIRIEVEGSFAETQKEIQLLRDSKTWDSMERRLATAVRNEVLSALKIAQDDLESDIFGFGRVVNISYPREWQVMKDNWDEIFPALEVEVEVLATLKTSGLALRGIQNR
jgi:spore germination protein KC